jgi:putative SOS response-associated peptidase YedK
MRRCLVPADGYYEWLRVDEKTKQPYPFKMKNDGPFAFAGVWDARKAPNGSWLQSFSILISFANELAARVHNRMPVILHPNDYERWLERDSEQAPVELLRPFEAEAMAASPCNPKVGSNAKNNGPEMLNSA